MSAGLDGLIKDIVELAEDRVRYTYDLLPKRGVESPIERYFYIALAEACLYMSSSPRGTVLPVAWATKSVEEQELVKGRIHIWAQYRALDWPADFVLGTISATGRKCFAIIECDGHDFHERTKEQAARDRDRDRPVQEMGWRIMRFTGSELYREPIIHVIQSVLDGWATKEWLP